MEKQKNKKTVNVKLTQNELLTIQIALLRDAMLMAEKGFVYSEQEVVNLKNKLKKYEEEK